MSYGKVVMGREAIYAALFARVSAITWTAIPISGKTTWGAASRKLLGWGDVPSDQMPAIFQTQVYERVQRDVNRPPRYVLGVEWRVYVAHLAQSDSEVIPTQQLNPILDAIQLAMEPNGTDGSPETNTLGKLVYDCKIVGEIKNFEGDLGDLGVLLIPVEIQVPF